MRVHTHLEIRKTVEGVGNWWEMRLVQWVWKTVTCFAKLGVTGSF